jgi:hypothetical protein
VTAEVLPDVAASYRDQKTRLRGALKTATDTQGVVSIRVTGSRNSSDGRACVVRDECLVDVAARLLCRLTLLTSLTSSLAAGAAQAERACHRGVRWRIGCHIVVQALHLRICGL